MNPTEQQKDSIIKFFIGFYNDLLFESGQVEETSFNISNVNNIFKRSLPDGLEKSRNGIINLSP